MTPLVAAICRALPGLRTSDDEADRLAYARDLWPRHHLAVRAGRPFEHRPGAVVWPASTDEVARLVRWARSEAISLVPFGAGSGVCGGILPRNDVVVVDLKRMARIRALDQRAPLVDVEAGHLGVPLERALGRAGLTLGHFPSSILCSTVGGWVATRSAGQCSGAYGKIEDMVVALECVTGEGQVVELRRRTSGPDLVPLVVGSEGTLAIVTGASFRLHPAPTSRGFGSWSFPTTQLGWEALREMTQIGLRPAVARLYDPFDAMIARRASDDTSVPRHASRPEVTQAHALKIGAPGLGRAALRWALTRPGALNALLGSSLAARALGGATLIAVFEGVDDGPRRGIEEARQVAESMRGVWEGETPAKRWLAHRYAVSYRQAPLFANGVFVDTMEVAARWADLGRLYDGVRRALGRSVFVMAHFSHAYPDGCCIYFSFAGSADRQLARSIGWDAACEEAYDRAWKLALDAVALAGGTIAHHHGVGRSKAPRLVGELGHGVTVVQGLMRAFDPDRILNPGNLVPEKTTSKGSLAELRACRSTRDPRATSAGLEIDRKSLLAWIDGSLDLATAERLLNEAELTLDVPFGLPAPTVAQWLAAGAPGARDKWLDPADHLVAGFDATLVDGRSFSILPAPRRSVGPDLSALFVGAGGRFGRIDRAWLRVHRRGVARPSGATFTHERDATLNEGEKSLIETLVASVGRPLRAD